HSLGGAFAQMLIERGLGAAGVGIAAATVKGVHDLPFSMIRTTAPVPTTRCHRGRTLSLDRSQFHYAFANTLDREQSDRVFERYHVPAAATVLFERAFANLHPQATTRIEFGAGRAPMLLIAFGEDHICPPGAVRADVARLRHSRGIVDYREFHGRPHFPA